MSLGVEKIIDPISGRSRFVFRKEELLPDPRICKDIAQASTTTKDLGQAMGSTDSKNVNAVSSEPASPAISAQIAPLSVSATSEVTLPERMIINVVGIDDASEDSKLLKSCLKRARHLSDGDVEVVPATTPAAADTVETAEDETVSILATHGSKKQKSKSKRKDTRLSSIDAEEKPRETKIKWGKVHARYLIRQVGGSAAIPEYSGYEWTLGLSDIIVSPSSSKEFSTLEDPDSDSEGETELTDAGVAALAGPKHAFSPRITGKKGGGSPKHGPKGVVSKGMKIPEIAPLDLPTAALPSAPMYKRRRTIPGWSVELGSVEELDEKKQSDLGVRYRTLNDKERAIFKVEKPYETRQLSHKKLPSEIGGNPLFRPLTDRQRVELYNREGFDTKQPDLMKRNIREARILDAIHKSREKVACQCHNLQPAEIKKWTVKRLHLECQSRGLDSSGARQDMVDRLVSYSAAIPTCKDHRTDLSSYAPDVVPGADGPFVLEPDVAVTRAQTLQQSVLRDNAQFFLGYQCPATTEEDARTTQAAASGAGTVTVMDGIIGENLCPCAASGIGCIEECRCRKYGCGNRQCNDNTAYAYDSESVRETLAEVLLKARHQFFFTSEEMREIRMSVAQRITKKVQAAKAALKHVETKSIEEADGSGVHAHEGCVHEHAEVVEESRAVSSSSEGGISVQSAEETPATATEAAGTSTEEAVATSIPTEAAVTSSEDVIEPVLSPQSAAPIATVTTITTATPSLAEIFAAKLKELQAEAESKRAVKQRPSDAVAVSQDESPKHKPRGEKDSTSKAARGGRKGGSTTVAAVAAVNGSGAGGVNKHDKHSHAVISPTATTIPTATTTTAAASAPTTDAATSSTIRSPSHDNHHQQHRRGGRKAHNHNPQPVEA